MSFALNQRRLFLFLLGFALIFGGGASAYSQFGLEKKGPEKKATEKEDDSFELDDPDADDETEDTTEETLPPSEPASSEKGKNGPKLGRAMTKSWETGVKLTAVSKCSNIVTMITIPMDWPEQKVTIMEEKEKTSNNVAKVTRRGHKNGGLQQMIVKVPELTPGKTAEASLVVKVTRQEILPPDAESLPKLSIPPMNKIPKAHKIYLEKSPNIESGNSQFRKLFTEITKGVKPDWAKVEAIYNYVRDNIQYNAANKAVVGNGALETLKLKQGDCKEMTAVFIAICRAGKIPARTVWIPGHCYVEFYLIDDDGVGYWFPCQVSGTYAFGGIPEMGPVLQKGDNFTFPEFGREKFRFVGQQVIGQNEDGPAGKPKHEFFENPL